MVVFFLNLDVLETLKCHLISGWWANMRNKLKVVLRKGGCWVGDIHKILETDTLNPLSLRGLCFKDRLFEEGGDENNATLKQQNALGCHELPRKNRIKSRLTFWILHLERQVVSGCGTWPRLFSSAWNLDTVQAADRISGANGGARQAKKR